MTTSIAAAQYRMIHDVYVLLDDGDQRLLREFNLNASQFALLLTLGDEQGWRLTDLSDRLLIDKSTATRVVDRLEQLGLVQRTADPLDRRVQRVILTDDGRLHRDRAREAHLASLEWRLRSLNSEEQQQLETLLHKLRDGLQADLDAIPLPQTAASIS